MFFKKKSEKGWLVIEFRDSTVGICHVRPESTGLPRVVFCEERPWSDSDPKSLEKVAREFHADRYQCTTLMDPTDYQILLVEAPPVKPDELKAAVRWRIKDMIDYHLDDAIVDVLDIPPPEAGNPRGHMMYAVASRNSVVRKMIDRFESVKMPLSVIDIPDTAQRNLAVRLEHGDKGIVMVSFGIHGGFITFTCRGELYLTRRIDIPLDDITSEDPQTREDAVSRAALEVQRSLDHFERQFHYVPLERVVIVPAPNTPALTARIRESVLLPTEEFELATVVDISEVPALADPSMAVRWLTSIGAGLRIEARTL